MPHAHMHICTHHTHTHTHTPTHTHTDTHARATPYPPQTGPGKSTVTALVYHTAWPAPVMHASLDGGEWTSIPLTPLAGWSVPAVVGLVRAAAGTFAVTDGAGAWDNNGGRNYTLGACAERERDRERERH